MGNGEVNCHQRNSIPVHSSFAFSTTYNTSHSVRHIHKHKLEYIMTIPSELVGRLNDIPFSSDTLQHYRNKYTRGKQTQPVQNVQRC